MRTRTLRTFFGDCRILIGGRLGDLLSRPPASRTVVVTDGNLRRLLGGALSGFPVIEIGQGESSKTLESAASVYRRLFELQADRATFVLGIGGGIVCDVAGFAASTYLRGIPFGLVPTTLLAQADASIGGKNGVNFLGVKNLIGAFRQPEFVLLDFALPATLPPGQVLCGAAEIVKHALIASRSLYDFLEREAAAFIALRPNVLKRAVTESLKIKTGIVRKDPGERGERRKLNFGHTLGHALESVLGVSHGRAVGAGMIAAIRISAALDLLDSREARRAESFLRGLGFFFELRPGVLPKVLETVRKDKKRAGTKIHFVLLEKIGKAKIVTLSFPELEGYLHDLCEPPCGIAR